MHYVIFDLEWNQPADKASALCKPLLPDGEIVEFGAVKLNEQFRYIDEFRCYVKPKFYPNMNQRISALTGIREQLLAREGIPFPAAFEKFIQWCGEDYTFMTWSMSDIPVLINNILAHSMEYYDFPDCCDLQRIFCREIMRSKSRISLDAALALMKETGESAHDALHDAKNTAKLCNHLDLDEYLHEYTFRVFAEPPIKTVYESRADLLEDAALQQFLCPWCGESISGLRWLSMGGSRYIAYGICPEEDEFFVELSIVNCGEEKFTARRIFFEMCDDLWEIYMDRKEDLERMQTASS